MGTTTIQPIDASAGVPQYSAQNERQGFAALMGGGSGRQLGARPGLRLGTPSNLITVTSTTWTAGTEFAAVLDPAFSTTQGPYRYAYSPSPSADSGSVTPADPTYPRKDIIVIRVDDASAGDPSGARQAPLVYRAGAATSMTPTAPTLNAREFLVGTINMPQVGAGSPTFTLNPQFFVAAGAPQPVYSQDERDALSLYDGLQVQRRDLPGIPTETRAAGVWRRDYADTGWISVPKLNGFTDYTATSNWLGLRYRVLNNVVYVNGAATNASSWVVNAVCGQIPSAYWPSGRVQGLNVQVDPTAGYLILAVAGAGGAAVSINAAYPIG